MYVLVFCFFFFFNDTATTEIYTLSLQTLFRSIVSCRISPAGVRSRPPVVGARVTSAGVARWRRWRDRKSTRLNSSHSQISYAVFCLKKKNRTQLSISYSIMPTTAHHLQSNRYT